MAAKKISFPIMEPVWLHMGYLALAHASITQIMKRLSTLHFWLQHKSSCASGELMKFVFLRFTFPVFEFHNFLFKLAYSLGEKRLLLLTGERDFVCSQELGINLGHCGDKLVIIGKRLVGAYPIADYLQTLKCSIYFCVQGMSPKDIKPNVKLRGVPFTDGERSSKA